LAYLQKFTVSELQDVQRILKLDPYYNSTYTKLKNNSLKLIHHHIDVAVVNITFEGCLVSFKEDFEDDVSDLPYDNSSIIAPDKYLSFIDKYGYTYISSIVLGGRA
jgi:hypothetical protein